MLKKQRALEILAAVQTRAQNEVAVQQRAGFAKKGKEIVAHLGSARRWRAVFGGPPKMSRHGTKHAKNGEEMVARRILEEPFDEPSNGARERRALPRSGILPRCIIRGLVGLSCGGNYLDFHVSSSRQRGNLDRGTGRGILFEIRAVYLVYRLKVAEAR